MQNLQTLVNQNQIPWADITPDILKTQLEQQFAALDTQLSAISATTPNPLMFYHDILAEHSKIAGLAGHLNAVRGDLGFSDVEVLGEKLCTAFTTKLYQNETLKELIKNAVPASEEQKRFKQLHLKKFRSQPEDLLNEFTKTKVAFEDNVKLDQKENKLTMDYSEELVAGLEPNVIQAIKKEDKLVLDSTGFTSMNVMTYAHSEELREKYWRFQQGRCPANEELAEKELELKQKIGEFFGHPTVCELNLEERMAKSVEEIKQFELGLHKEVHKVYEADIARLEKKFNIAIKPWNLAYYVEKDKKEVCEFDVLEFKKYFEADGLLQRFLKLLTTRFGVTFTLDESASKWHETVTAWKMERKNQPLGTIFLDLVQRENKRPGAWCNRLGPRTYTVVCNFSPKPETGPHELEFDEVNTLFHEFGHAMHAVLGRSELELLRSFEVFWDFVEVPSQFLENLCYEPAVLKKLGKGPNGVSIPDDLIAKNEKRKKYLNSTYMMRQLQFGWLDIMLHSSSDWKQIEPTPGFSRLDNYIDKICKEFIHDFGFKHRSIYRHFTHIFSSVYGYTCGYYSYFWADVIQAHLYEHYQKENDMEKYIETILVPGNTSDPAELVKQYCGGFGFDAFLRSYGLKE